MSKVKSYKNLNELNENNQFLILIESEKNKIDMLLDKIDKDKEFEFLFFRKNKLDFNKERYISMLKFINAMSNKYKTIGPIESLDVNLSYNNINYRVTIKNNNNDFNMIYNNLLKKNNNFNIFKMLIFLAKKDKEKKTYSVIKKIRDEKNIFDLNTFDMRVKLSDEIDIHDKIIKNNIDDKLITDILSRKDFKFDIIHEIETGIMYRYKSRTSLFFVNNEKDKLVLDLSYTKSNKNILFLNKSIGDYELELELTTNKITNELRKNLYDSVEKILKMNYQSNFLINIPKSNQIINGYKTLLNIDLSKYITNLDGRNPISLEIQHLSNILPNKYAVTDKADGERYFLIVLNDCLYFISKNLKIKDSGIVLNKKQSAKYNNSIFDGEYIFINSENKHVFMIFDCLILNGIDVRNNEKIIDRLKNADNFINDCMIGEKEKGYNFKSLPTMNDFDMNKISKFYGDEIKLYYKNFNHDLAISSKKYPLIRRKFFIPVTGGDRAEIYKYSYLFWNIYKQDNDAKWPYMLDGLIYHPLEEKYSTKDIKLYEYKWKPPDKNSIDFYIEFKKDPLTNKVLKVYDNSNDDFERDKVYKICNLYVGKNVRGKEVPIIFDKEGFNGEAYIFLENDEARDIEGDIIADKTVVEFYYNNDASTPDKQRWIPLRTRHDKTEMVERYKKQYGNYSSIGDSVWRSITKPVLMSDYLDLSKGGDFYNKKMEEISKKIDKNIIITSSISNKYYQKIYKLAEDFRSFHNWVKSNIIYTYCHYSYYDKKQKVLDFAHGKGGDQPKFFHSEVDYCLGLELFQDNILSPVNGAVSRYVNNKKKYPNFPKMDFIQADLNTLLTYDDQIKALPGMTEKNKQMLKKSFVDEHKFFDIINCQFAIHYFLKDEQGWKNFKQNINNNLKEDGIFLVTTLSGKKVKNILKGKENYSEYYTDESGEKKMLFDIIKKYDEKKSGVGQKIDLFAAWMFEDNNYYSEFLVDEDFLESELKKDCNLELIDFDYFENQYNINEDYLVNYSKYQSIDKTKKFLSDAGKFYTNDSSINEGCKKFSFLNCYYVFKKNSNKLQKGGNPKQNEKFNFDDYYKANMKEYNSKYSFLNSIHYCLRNNEIIPKSVDLEEFCNDLKLNLETDSKLDDTKKKKLCKKTIISHEIDDNSELESIIEGLNVFILDKDCNNDYECQFIKKSKNDKNIILLKEKNKYYPLLRKENDKSIFDQNDIKNLAENSDKI